MMLSFGYSIVSFGLPEEEEEEEEEEESFRHVLLFSEMIMIDLFSSVK